MIAVFLTFFVVAFAADPAMQIFKGTTCEGTPVASVTCKMNECCPVNGGLAYFQVTGVDNGQATTHVCKNSDCATQCIVNGAVACGGCGTLMPGAASFKVVCPTENNGDWSELLHALSQSKRIKQKLKN